MPNTTHGVDSRGQSTPLAVDERGRLLLSPQQHLTRAQFPARLLDWAADNLLLTVLLLGVNAQLGAIIYLLAR